MDTAPIQLRNGLVAALVLSGLWLAGPVQAAEDEVALRRKALALNDVTGDNPIQGEIKALVDDPVGTKKLLGVALALAKQKDQPFKYNGAYILARTALQLRELDTSKAFYRICAEQAGKLQSPQKLVQAYSGMLAIMDLLYREKKYEASLKVSQEFLELLDRQGVSSPMKAGVLRQMCRTLAKQGKVDEANRLVEDLLKVRDSDWRNLELRGWLQNETGHPEEAVKTFETVLERIAKDDSLEAEDKTEVQNEVRGQNEFRGSMLDALAKLGKIDEANKVIDAILKGKKDDCKKLYLKGRLQREIGHYSGAAKTYETLLQRIPKEESLKEDEKPNLEKEVRYILSSVYVDFDRIDKATEQLQTLLAQEPDSPSFNNDLGYIWADHDKNLDEAETMIRKALEQDRKQRKARPDLLPEEDKDSAAYLDSLGWVLFKKKKYQEAKKYLALAIKEEEGKHIEIYDHLGDVHMALGEKAEAVDIWRKALSLETSGPREQQRKAQVEKKIKANE